MVVALGGGGGVYYLFVSWFLVQRVPWDQRLFVESVVFPTDPPPGDHIGAEIYETGG